MAKKLKPFLVAFSVVVTLLIISLGVWVHHLDSEIITQLEQKNLVPPMEFYSSPWILRKGHVLNFVEFKHMLLKRNYRERTIDQALLAGDFVTMPGGSCQTQLSFTQSPEVAQCVIIKDPEDEMAMKGILLDSENQVLMTLAGNPLQEIDTLEFAPLKFAQYLGNQPILQTPVNLGEVPAACLNGIMAIEDDQFLEHSGISPTGIVRAFWKNLQAGRSAQGGSTITQQLVKNYFLSPEKTLRRKLTELAMSVIFETHASKDAILETYLNIIYLGQSGAFEIRGYGAAADYYFNHTVDQLSIPECALLAAIVNSPGSYNPFTKPEKALKRRSLVLHKMQEKGWLSEEEVNEFEKAPLPTQKQISISETAPYFIDATLKQLQTLGFNDLKGLKIYTTLDLESQSIAQQSVRNHLSELEKSVNKVKKQKAKGLNLEGTFVSVDPHSGAVTSLVGGRDFKMTQYNRAVTSQRQIGSTVKPFVLLTGLQNGWEGEEVVTAMTQVKDEKFKYTYEHRVWEPENYEKKYFGMVPLFVALAKSLNAATATVGLNVGLDKVIANLHLAGLKQDMKPLPSLTLGAVEANALTMAEAYTTLQRFGEHIGLTFVRQIQARGKTVFEYKSEPTQVFDKAQTGVLVGMMKQTFSIGSAKGAKYRGFTSPAAGKTGTTSDYKDSWFAGFTPHLVAISWVGFDNNLPTSLTGSSGALPIWVDFMKQMGRHFSSDDFQWPEDTEVKTVNVPSQFPELSLTWPEGDPEDIDLVFKKGTGP